MNVSQVIIGARVQVNSTYVGYLRSRTGTIIGHRRDNKYHVRVMLDGYKKEQVWHISFLDLIPIPEGTK